MSCGAFDRLDGYKIHAERTGLSVNGQYSTRFALIKVCQRVEHQQSIFTDVVPALLTGTTLWDLVRGGPLGPTAHWLIQGFPHPLAQGVSERAALAFPCPENLVDVTTGLCGRSQKALAGNAMHLAAIGAWACYNFATIRRNLPVGPASP